MKKIPLILFLFNFLFSIDGKVIFYDGTSVEGKINMVSNNSIYLTPIGLDFPEEILMDYVDSLKLNNGKILVASNTVILLYENGNYINPAEQKQHRKASSQTDEIQYLVTPNWSLNIYTGYPILKASSFDYYDDLNPIIGLSVGSPYGLFLGDFFMNVIAEIAFYDFDKIANPGADPFGGVAYQLGISPGFFIGETSISLTLCTGLYHAGEGFIGGGSLDFPLGDIIIDNYGDYSIVDILEDHLESFEIRFTTRSNIVKKTDGLWTGWIGAGISFGYEF